MEKGVRAKPAAARREKSSKNGKLFRKRSFKYVGSFMNKIMRTLGTLSHFGGYVDDAREPEDDDGGFRDGTPCTLLANSGKMMSKEEPPPGTVDQLHKKTSTSASTSSSCGSSLREKLCRYYGDRMPGVLGLKNHGNTCFMNAVVQCLSNTDLLAEYLGLERYKLDMCPALMDGAPGKGDDALVAAAGEVTEHLASLVRALWTLQYTPQLSVEFKATVSRYGTQFRGNSQHDALEFLLWLLDRVHEDVSLQPYCNNNNSIQAPPKQGPGGPEADLPADPTQPRCDQPGEIHSFVQEHFQAQYKSSLTCPHCLKQSNTFDPFLCISLPIPLRHTRPVCVTLVFSSRGQRYLRVGLSLPLLGSLACLRRMVADEGHLSPEQVILTEVYSTGFQRSFFDEDDLTCVADNDVIYAFQAPPLYVRAGSAQISGYHHSLPSSPFSSGPEGQRLPPSGTLSSEFLNQGGPARILLLVCNASQAIRFGPPFLMREDRAISWDQLQQSILSKLYYLMINGAQAQNARVLFNLRVVGVTCSSAPYSYLSPQDGRPLYHPAVERALRLCGSGGPPHVKLIIEWEPRVKDCLFGNIQEEVVKDAESVRSLQQQHAQQLSCSLDECFQLYTKEEQLAPDDAWRCPHCRQLQQGVVKMSLWTLPDILILHLKRFRQVAERRNKLTTLVSFPLTGLDMAPHVVKRSRGQSAAAAPPDSAPAPANFLYDLYAVCNHHGGLHGGHYTAFCRNSVDGQWYSYDDSSADAVPHAEVATRGAYILFYQRRNTVPPWSASSSTSGSTSSSASDHWLVRLREHSQRDSLGPGGSLGVHPGPLPQVDSPELPVFGEETPRPAETDGDPEASRPQGVRGSRVRSVSMRSPTKTRDALSKVLPLRWSLGAKERSRPPHQTQVQLVEYLESGRRPRCSREPIAALVATPPMSLRAAQARSADGNGKRDTGSGSGSGPAGGADGGGSPSPRRPEGQSRAGGLSEKTNRPPEEPCWPRLARDQARSLDPQTQLRGAILGGHVSHSAPPSRDSTLRRSRAQTGPTGSPLQRDLLHATVDRKLGREEGGRSQESLLSLVRPPFLRRDAQRAVGGSSSPATAVESLIRASGQGPPARAPCGHVTTQLSLSNGTLSGGYAHCGSGVLANGNPRTQRHPEDAGDITRAHSSGSIPGRPDQALRRCASLQRSGELAQVVHLQPHHHQQHQHHPPHQHLLWRMAEKPVCEPLQRVQYSTTSLGRQGTGLGVRF